MFAMTLALEAFAYINSEEGKAAIAERTRRLAARTPEQVKADERAAEDAIASINDMILRWNGYASTGIAKDMDGNVIFDANKALKPLRSR